MASRVQISLADQKKIVEDYLSGIGYKDLAERYGYTKKVIERVINRNCPEKRGRIIKRIPEEKINNLVNLYNSGMSSKDICKLFDCSEYVMLETLKANKVEIKKQGNQKKDNLELVKSIVALYKEGHTQDVISSLHSISQTTVGRILKDVDPTLVQIGRKWRTNGKTYQNGGYVLIRLLEDDPYYCMINTGGYVVEHRYVMAKHLGRPLTQEEEVHHIDGDRKNNNISNLQLVQVGHGAGQKFQCCDCGSHNIKPIEI